MTTVRFLRLQLSYGCHDRAFDFPAGMEPVVIAGPNGSGKSTLLEGLVRTLFGFNRRAGIDSDELEWRRPWNSAPGTGRVELHDGDGRLWVVERQFASNDVSISTPGGSTEIWRGDGNPAATNASACDFRQRLRALVGFERLDSYVQTAYVPQGGLLATTVDESLLRAASGSPIDVGRALEGIEQAYRRWSREPIAAGRGRAQKPRERETLLQHIAEVEGSLATARAAELARFPLVVEQGRLQRTLDLLAAAVDALESAQLVLVRRDALATEIQRLEERIATREHQIAELDQARAEVHAARSRADELGDGPDLPDDFPERAAALEQLWNHRARVESRRESARRALDPLRLPSRWWTLPGAALAAAGAIGWILLREPFAVAMVALGLSVGAVAFLVRRSVLTRHTECGQTLASVEGELEEIGRSIERQLEPIPAALGLAPTTLGERRSAFLRRRAVEAAGLRASEGRDAAMRRIAMSAELDATVARDERAVLDALQRSVTHDRNVRAEKRLRMEEICRMELALPAGVRNDVEEVQRALAATRVERSGLERELRAVADRLAEQRPSRAPVALGDELAALRQQLDEVDEAAEAHRAAFALLDEAHREFREEDQRRLIELISAHLQQISEGTLGPLEAPGKLDEARLHAFGRDVPLDYRPLSYGQLHLVLLAVRLGAADFMARWGMAVPLILDEPFANLDDENATAVWKQVRAVARERQVLVATQESALLDRLGIRPDVALATRPVATRSEPGRAASPRHLA